MKKLINGIVEFRKGLTEEKRALFKKLALGQKPDAFFIACSDSRVLPNLFASTNPGDLFSLRNIGNMMPPFSATHDHSAAAALEYAVNFLKVSDVIVCGHSECGAMQAIIDQLEDPQAVNLTAWLKNAHVEGKNKHFIPKTSLSEVNQLSQKNVLEQIEHLKTYPFVAKKLKKHELDLHGFWFDISRADVYCYEEKISEFVLIDEEEAKVILTRIQH